AGGRAASVVIERNPKERSMGVVTRYTSGYPDPTKVSAFSRNAHEAVANLKVSYFSIAAQNGDSIGSVFKIARLPSNAMIFPGLSSLFAAANAGLTSVSIGVNNNIGTKQVGALQNALNIAAGGTFALAGAVAQANYGQRLWQLLGLASDPGMELDLEITLNAASTAASLINGQLVWSVPGL
ncbi:MAG: hypothetical protein KGL46_14270, partial [Hyphomicrobiales bacterium]|nr:hypothetical protein [Hyphomicrobiales bacterium]